MSLGRSEQSTYDVGLLDSWTIRDGIGKRNTKFYDVRSTLLHSKQDGDGVFDLGIACSHESDQSWTCL